ncbi:hemerythrin domain-containing protein [Guyparkeria sp. SCN-R1]|uniref:hemerythrin domain-containing protein n=1 Tax=Guyparkeria sp. SCN-R1 TaxID=2341113 RepID=UPI000F6521A7|nr:hemerythrin domain-containing protein [Guyparkeria sp. SCN-R1]RRQ24189.1 hemerythrin domain-containing protein [Guyparkeria sp. SCN-R1]
MQRHESLQPLSREHHQTLKIARRLQWGEPDADLLRDLTEHRGELEAHFATEESIGRQALRQCPTDTTLAGQLDRMQREHRQIEELLTAVLDGDGEQSNCHRLGELLVAHVRFEERELFNHLQEGCLPGQAGEPA